jgi:hypothetical protein
MQSSGSQWLVVGCIGLGLFGGDKVRSLIQENLIKALSSSPSYVGPDTARHLSPIVIHTGGGMHAQGNYSRGYLFGLALQVTIGAASCWAAYAFISTLMPECIKEVLPVNRKLFDRAVQSLGEGIIHVKDSLFQQILSLIETQEELGEKQDRTLSEVMLVRDDLHDARGDLSKMGESLTRCESSLSSSKRLQGYTSRGVRLLVRCVAALLPGNDQVLAELLQYIKEAEGMEDADSTCPSSAHGRNIAPTVTPTIQEQLQTTLDHDNPALMPVQTPPTRNTNNPFKSPPHSNDNLDAIHSLLGIVRDGNGSTDSYRSPMPISVRG